MESSPLAAPDAAIPALRGLTRRSVLAGGVASLALAGCSTTASQRPAAPLAAEARPIDPRARMMYAAMPQEQFPIPAADLTKLEPQFYRQLVDDPTGEQPGTVVVSTAERFLYLVREDGTAMRYGVGLGRAGFEWSGRALIQWKRPWPTWTPPAEMIAREPELEQWRQGMPPGLDNPLGARALYIFKDGQDTLYRLHGTNQAWSIGRAVSSGCVRLLNQDIIDLYGRVPARTPILVA